MEGNYVVYEGEFIYTGNHTQITFNGDKQYTFDVAELLEHDFTCGDKVIYGKLKDPITTIMFVGKKSECDIERLKTALDKIYENGLTFDVIYIETILMELYKTLNISYIERG
jgi:hypothetical protein